MMRKFRSPSRWNWVLPAIAAAFIAACDTAFEGINQTQTWGFVTIAATRDDAGAHFADAEGLFFNGNLSAVPNAEFTVQDTCTDGLLSSQNNLVGVTYLDAGQSVIAIIGGVESALDRTTTAQGLAYVPSSPIAYTPGDSIVVNIDGVPGGFPTGNIRAKTAEAFIFPTNIDIPLGTEDIELEWTPPDDPRSAMVVSLRYESTQNPGVLSRNVLCSFLDDGAHSIPFRWYQPWAASTGQRTVVATRLRTTYVGLGDANLGVISTYQVPTPPNP